MATKCAKDDCGAWAKGDDEYCHHHGPWESEGVDLYDAEAIALRRLTKLAEGARGQTTQCRAAEAILEHVREERDA